MKRILKLTIAASLLFSLLFCTVVSAADSYVTIHTNSSWETSERTVNGAVFTSDYNNYTSATTIQVTKNGKTQTVTDYAGNSDVVTNGSLVYYCRKKSGNTYLYRMNINTGSQKKIGKLGTGSGPTLMGKYKNDIFYVKSMPEGIFAKKNIVTNKVTSFSLSGKRVSRAAQKGKYFVLADGTGAGYSYLGVFNAADSSFKKVSSRPLSWNQNTKYIYYIEKVDDNFYSNNKVRIKRYCFATGEKKTLVKSLQMRYATKITSKYVKYYDTNGNLKTLKYAG